MCYADCGGRRANSAPQRPPRPSSQVQIKRHGTKVKQAEYNELMAKLAVMQFKVKRGQTPQGTHCPPSAPL